MVITLFRFSTYLFCTALIILLTVFPISKAHALSIIRDVELELVIEDIVHPILEAAELEPDQVEIYIVNNSSVNAFVAGGMNIFIHTGLLTLKEDPHVLAGVMAHEVGHITGGHLSKTSYELQQKGLQSAITYMLGIAAIAAGAPEAGQALVMGGQHIAQRQMLHYSRSHEDAADQAALRYLNSLNISPQGLIDLLNYLSNMQSQQYGAVDPYSQTHPLSRERVLNLQHYMDSHTKPFTGLSEGIKSRYKIAVAKLKAYISPPEDTFREYPLKDQSIEARYARAVAYYKKPILDKALAEMDSLLEEQPRNPFYLEMRAQILLDHGKIGEALSYYEAANKVLKHPLLKLELAMAIIAAGDRDIKQNKLLDAAIKNLQQVLVEEPKNSMAWHYLGVAYGRQGNFGKSYLSFAEEAFIRKKKKSLKKYLALAEKHLPEGSPSLLRLEDMRAALKNETKKKKGIFN